MNVHVCLLIMYVCFYFQKYASHQNISNDIRMAATAVAAKQRNNYYKKKVPINISQWNQHRDQV